VATCSSACDGDESSDPDAFLDARKVGPLTALPILDGYNHASETSIAAHAGHVVVLFINQALVAEDSFEYPSGGHFRRVGILRSSDHGETYGSHEGLATADTETSDPVVRVDAAGNFWAAALDVDTDRARLWRSTDRGATWSELNVQLPVEDKEWLVIDDQEDVLYVQGRAGIVQFDGEGNVFAQAAYDPSAGMNAVTGYAYGGTAYFFTLAGVVMGWDGTGEPSQVGDKLSPGDQANTFTVSAGAMGATASGRHWIVRSVHGASGSPVLVGVADAPGGPYAEQTLSAGGAVAFLPAATLDEEGRLHVIWYDSSGEQGVLYYTHSTSPSLAEGFLAPIVVDDDACPGQGWYPYSASDPPPGGRRLREYIDIAVDGARAHIAWTHAPDAPSRVYATYVEF
jgi:hypothetical protein